MHNVRFVPAPDHRTKVASVESIKKSCLMAYFSLPPRKVTVFSEYINREGNFSLEEKAKTMRRKNCLLFMLCFHRRTLIFFPASSFEDYLFTSGNTIIYLI